MPEASLQTTPAEAAPGEPIITFLLADCLYVINPLGEIWRKKRDKSWLNTTLVIPAVADVDQ